MNNVLKKSHRKLYFHGNGISVHRTIKEQINSYIIMHRIFIITLIIYTAMHHVVMRLYSYINMSVHNLALRTQINCI